MNAITETVTELIGVYDADGGLRGELSYVVGHLTGRRRCGLCDITHSPVRRKAAWDAMIAGLGVPFVLLHRNERPADVAAATTTGVPSVLARLGSGELVEVLGPHDLEEVQGDVDRFHGRLLAALDERSLALA